MFIKITPEPIQIEEALREVRHTSCGAVALFEGNIRSENDGKKVFGLEYEVYPELFNTEVERIEIEMRGRWEIHHMALIQRVGKLDVGETGILIAISSIHRRDSLEAVTYMIEEFKKRAPVWKKEYTEEGVGWVQCHHGREQPT